MLVVLGWVGLGQSADGLGWIGSHKIDPWTTLLSGACGWSRYRWTKNGRPLTVNGLGVQQVLGRGSLILSRDDNGSHFLTRDPRDPRPATHDYSRVMTRDYCSFQSGPLSGSALKIEHHYCHKTACSWNLVNLIMGQRVTGQKV